MLPCICEEQILQMIFHNRALSWESLSKPPFEHVLLKHYTGIHLSVCKGMPQFFISTAYFKSLGKTREVVKRSCLI